MVCKEKSNLVAVLENIAVNKDSNDSDANVQENVQENIQENNQVNIQENVQGNIQDPPVSTEHLENILQIFHQLVF